MYNNDPLATPFVIVGPEGIFEGDTLGRYLAAVAAHAVRVATGINWQMVEYCVRKRGMVWDVEGLSDDGGRSGPYRLTLPSGLPR